ncbi:hypothetical protein [Spirosoma sp. KUDC1026]|uniref:hypothetical protein n=1 Tax=Spirosoma sp. KUDC1026 TaxID=2745947 RepID=UPI00159BC94B|nr:hypothetical protein [Spirosoma sp. KUDC1026]QKZ15378.1 hypothetical protein HU175_23265 [Spirosoma sp. KUDC1026]
MNALSVSFRQLLGLLRLVGFLYAVTLVLGLLAALPFYNTLKSEYHDSLEFIKLLDGFDYTVFSDFMRQSQQTLYPLFSVGRWLGVFHLFLSVFFSGGILFCQAQAGSRFHIGTFWQACSHYFGRFLKVAGVTILFVLVNTIIWVLAGSLAIMAVSDPLTERGQFWIGITAFALFMLTTTLLLCVGDYAKVILFEEDDQRAFRAFGRAGRLVLKNPGKTYGLYWLLILIGTAVFGLYFLVEEHVTMSGWLTISLLFLVQQAVIFVRAALKVWSLGLAYNVYKILPKPAPVARPVPTVIPTHESAYTAIAADDASGDSPAPDSAGMYSPETGTPTDKE